MRFRTMSWWYWLATAVLVAWGLAGAEWGIPAAILLTGVQVVHFAVRNRSPRAFPVQVRAVYLGLLLAGLWPPLAWLHWIQVIGTTGLVLFDYCLLARLLSLLPGHRTEPFTLRLFCGRIFSRPVRGSILAQNTKRTRGNDLEELLKPHRLVAGRLVPIDRR